MKDIFKRTQMYKDNNAKFSPDSFIELDPEEREHPYSIVSNDLIRDSSISPNCRWLIIYLLSNAPGWKIKISQFTNAFCFYRLILL